MRAVNASCRQTAGAQSGSKAAERLEKYHADVLKHVCALFDINESGSKAKLIQNIVEFCERPKASGHAYKGGNASSTSGQKRKKGSSKKEKKAEGDKVSDANLMM